jgi:hypothetical protein
VFMTDSFGLAPSVPFAPDTRHLAELVGPIEIR